MDCDNAVPEIINGTSTLAFVDLLIFTTCNQNYKTFFDKYVFKVFHFTLIHQHLGLKFPEFPLPKDMRPDHLPESV
jgi:hypothetical protein